MTETRMWRFAVAPLLAVVLASLPAGAQTERIVAVEQPWLRFGARGIATHAAPAALESFLRLLCDQGHSTASALERRFDGFAEPLVRRLAGLDAIDDHPSGKCRCSVVPCQLIQVA